MKIHLELTKNEFFSKQITGVAALDPVRHELSDEEFAETPAYMRGLDRVVDPLAPNWMSSR